MKVLILRVHQGRGLNFLAPYVFADELFPVGESRLWVGTHDIVCTCCIYDIVANPLFGCHCEIFVVSPTIVGFDLGIQQFPCRVDKRVLGLPDFWCSEYDLYVVATHYMCITLCAVFLLQFHQISGNSTDLCCNFTDPGSILRTPYLQCQFPLTLRTLL